MFYNSTVVVSRYLLGFSATPVLGAILAFCCVTRNPLLLLPLVISINMAKGLAVGVNVCASSKAVIGERVAKARYGADWKNKLAYDIINEQVGFGRSRKWRISFSSLNKVVDLSARALTVVAESFLDEDIGGLVATSSAADYTANAEARDEVNEIEDGEDHLGEGEAFNAGGIDGQSEIDNDGIDSEQRSENVIVCQGVEWHICDCIK